MTKALLAVLDQVEQLVEDIPPVDNAKSRFGNPAFQTFYDRAAEVRLLSFCSGSRAHASTSQLAPQWHRTIPGLSEDSIPHLLPYLVESWGNRTRIDYGSGMELNFLCWLWVQLEQTSQSS